MIDWLWLRMCVDASTQLPAGRVMSITHEGEIEWQSERWLQARGSHDQTMALRMDARGNLNVSGSPAKFLQGHNLFGSDDVQGLSRAVIARVLDAFPQITLGAADLVKLDLGLVTLLRTDITNMYSTGSRQRCDSFITEAAETSHYKHRGRGLYDRGTLYWGRGSRHFCMKAYAKGTEISKKGHELAHVECRDQMLAYADDALRMELQMNARALKGAGLDQLCNWQSDTPQLLYSEHLAKLNLSGNMPMKPAAIESLPARLQVVHAAWQSGADLRAMFPRNTFYRYRRELLPFGIDIAAKQAKSNVVKLYTVIEAKPLGVPDFALGTPLYFDPARVA